MTKFIPSNEGVHFHFHYAMKIEISEQFFSETFFRTSFFRSTCLFCKPFAFLYFYIFRFIPNYIWEKYIIHI